jgi:UDP-GlcNAc:undecaprenyl-phosphate GlcNAc-1-phosphate transferase
VEHLVNLSLIHLLLNFAILFYFDFLKEKINIFDYPDNKRKFHNKPVALFGGLIFFFNIILFTFIYFNNLSTLEVNIILSSTFFLIIGIFDDKYDLSPKIKFIFLISILLIFFYLNENMIIKYLNIYGHSIYLYPNFEILFSILCVLLFVNAINLFDGMNLQSSLYSLFVLFYLFNKDMSQEIILPLIISLLLIIYLNMKNKIFMGNSGTMFIGCLVSMLVINNYQVSNISTIDEIFLLMMLPGIDMFRLFIQRIYNKKNPFIGDREHVHHYFLEIYGYKYSIFFITILSIAPILLNSVFSSKLIIFFFIIIYFTLIIFLKIKNNKKFF